MHEITTLEYQKKHKPNIEDVLPHYLGDEALRNALDFIAYLRENKMKPSWTIHNAWKAVNKGKVLYYIRLPVYESHFKRPNQPSGTNWERSWCVTPFLRNIDKYEHLITDETEKKIITDSFYGCKPYCKMVRCAEKGNPKIKITICGTELSFYCGASMLENRSLWIVNPNAAEISCIKKFLEMEKSER